MDKIYLAEHHRLERRVYRTVRCRATAGDIVQDLFLKLWEKAVDSALLTSSYLSRSAANAAIDHIRAEKSRAAALDGLPADHLTAPVFPPDQILASRQDLALIQQAIAGLPERTRHIFLLNRAHGCTFVEIAAAMGISERAVAKHMARALDACEAAVGQ